jgi:hypothetical protein
MKRTTVTMQDQIGRLNFEDQALQKRRPLTGTARKIDSRQGRPSQAIASVKVYPRNTVTTRCQRQPQTVHKWSGNTLQKKKAAMRKYPGHRVQRPNTPGDAVGP